MDKDAVVIIPAAGQGKRMAAGQNKLFLSLENKTILQHTLDLFLNHPRILHVYFVIASKLARRQSPNSLILYSALCASKRIRHMQGSKLRLLGRSDVNQFSTYRNAGICGKF